jgi:predicted deacylase
MQEKRHPISLPGSSASYELRSFHFGAPGRGSKVYIQAGLHADEVPGMLVAQYLRTELQALDVAGKILGEVVLVPAANPLGLAQAIQGTPFGRFDLSNGINFNRGYTHVANDLKGQLAGKLGPDVQANVATVRALARAAVAAKTPINDAQALKQLLLGLAIDADIVLDLHCDNEAVLHLYTGTPLADACAPLAARLGAHAVLLAREAGDEPFDEACSRLWWELAEHAGPATPVPMACLAATVELRGEMDVNHAHARQDANALLAFMADRGVIERAPVPAPSALCRATPLEAVEPVVAPHAGIVVFSKQLGQMVEAGEAIAELIEPVSGNITLLRASVAGVFFARTAHRHLLRGMQVGKIAGATPFRAGKLLSQ